jgi:broad specificity phosphatase PhoE
MSAADLAQTPAEVRRTGPPTGSNAIHGGIYVAKLYLVRHGRAAAGISENVDPGLDDLGYRQAQAAADVLSRNTPMPLFSSPLRRARETAVPLANQWQSDVIIETRIAEIPFQSRDLAERSRWLQSVMPGSWTDLDDYWQRWRRGVVECLLSHGNDAVFFSHFIAINVAVGAAWNDDRMVVFRPDNASITLLSNEGGVLRVLSAGGEASTFVN